MEIQTGFPFRGRTLDGLRSFLEQNGLKYDVGVEYSVILHEDGRIAASGSLDGRVLKCIAVSPEYQGSGAAAQIVTELIGEAARRGRYHLFLFTKPENEVLFGNLGFFAISKTIKVLLMENKKDGIKDFVSAIQKGSTLFSCGGGENKRLGAVVVNCNPFSRGHRYLIETAAKQCGRLLVFVVAEDKSAFSADMRMAMVSAGVADIPHVCVHSTGPYLVSQATFPDYFLKDSIAPERVNTELDLSIFVEHFAKPLGISVRFVGNEPFDPVTQKYNRQMAKILPRYNIELVEIPRLEIGGLPVSASRIRRLMEEGNREAVRELVPETTMNYLLPTGEDHDD